MSTKRKNKETSLEIHSGLPDGNSWSPQDIAGIEDFIKNEIKNRSTEQQVDIELLSLKYKMEDCSEHPERQADWLIPLISMS